MKPQDEAFETWWVQTYPRVLATLLRAGASQDQAEDVLQDVAILALRASETLGFRDKESFEQWLYRHARWKFLDHLRFGSRMRQPDVGATTGADSATPFQEPDQETKVMLSRVLDTALRRLPQRQLTVMRLYLLGFSSQEIAEQLAISPATARSHLRFARNRLAKLLKEQEEASSGNEGT